VIEGAGRKGSSIASDRKNNKDIPDTTERIITHKTWMSLV
jgi:hypothetical protein